MFDLSTPCIEWTGGLTADGYGRIQRGGTTILAHRDAWEREVGPIPDDLTIDHGCFNRRCVNTKHMEVVTRGENTRRMYAAGRDRNQHTDKTHCDSGHPLDGDNLYMHRGHRRCKICRRVAAREAYRRKNNVPLELQRI